MATAVKNSSQYTIEDDDQPQKAGSSQYSIEDDTAAPAADAPNPTWEKIKEGAKDILPGYRGLEMVSGAIGKVGDYAQRKANEAEVSALHDTAQTGKPKGILDRNPAGAWDTAARIAHMGAGFTQPENVAMMGGAIVAPEIAAPAFIAHGASQVWDPAKKLLSGEGLTPEEAEQGLSGAAEMVGGATAGAEIPHRGGLLNTVTGKLADRVVRGTPLTEAGKLEAAKGQAMAVKKPTMTETEYSQKVTDALPDLQRVAQDNQGKIKTPRQAVQAINGRISQMEAPIGDHLATLTAPEDMVHPDQYQAQINKAVDDALSAKPGSYTDAEIAKAKKTVNEFLGDRPKTMQEIEGNRRRLNQDAEKYFNSDTAGKNAIDVSDATARAQRAAGNAIRDLLYGDDATPGLLEKSGVTAVDQEGQPVSLRDFRRKVGNLMDVRDHFEDAITRAEATGNWKPWEKVFSGPSFAAGGLGLVSGAAAGGPLGALFGTLAGEGIKSWGDYLRTKNPNLNTEKMFRNLERSGVPNTAQIQTATPVHQYPNAIGPTIPQHINPIGPEPAPPTVPHQMSLPIPHDPAEAPLFTLQPTIQPGTVPKFPPAPTEAPPDLQQPIARPAVAAEAPQPQTAIGKGAEGVLRPIGAPEPPAAQGAPIAAGVKPDEGALGRVEAPKPREEFVRPKEDTTLKTGEAVKGIQGDEAVLKTPAQDFPVRYRVVEADDLIASHDPKTFAKNPDYPAGVQERAYHSSKEAQNRVTQQAQNYDPSFTVNTNPDAVNGPPVVTQDGIVLGGNSRAMSTKRLYSDGNGDVYKNRLVRDANSFGLKPEDIQGMKNPVLVREMTEPITDREQMRKIGSDLNRSFTGALGTNEKAVSAGKSISQGTMDKISGLLSRGTEQLTLREAMREDPKTFIDAMVSDGVITERERPQYIDNSTGGLNEEGRNFVERTLLGSVLDDTRILDGASKSDLNKIEGSLADLSTLMARQDEWDVTPLVRKALLERASMNARGLTIEDMARQQDMFSNAPRNPAVDAMAEALDKKPRELRAAVKQFADDARQDVKGQGTMSFAQAPEAWKAFNDAFGTKLTDQQYHEGLRDILREEVEHGTGEAEGRNPAPAPDEARAEDRGSAGEKPEGPDLGILPHPEAVELKPGETTFEHFYDKENDRWAPERAANHDAVAENAVEGKTPPPEGQAPQAIITVGGTASGKSTLTRSILGDNHNQVNVDSDHLKLYVPEYEGLKESDPQKAAARVHDESKAMSKRVIAEAVKRGLDFVYDTSTGGGGEALFNRLKDMGYKIHVVFADVPVDEAIQRAAKRAEESTDPANRDRIVPEEVIRKKHQQAAEAFGKYRTSPAVDQVSAYDTSTRPPKQFYERTAEGGEKIHDQDVMDRVEEKARGGKTKK